jgi:hypothetical protein
VHGILIGLITTFLTELRSPSSFDHVSSKQSVRIIQVLSLPLAPQAQEGLRPRAVSDIGDVYTVLAAKLSAMTGE